LSLGTPLQADGDKPAMQQIFLIDVLALASFTDTYLDKAIVGLLSSRATMVVWDGRMINIELHAHFGVPLSYVIDLQIAEIIGRKKSEQDRIARLRGCLGWDVMKNQSNKALFADMHTVANLSEVLSEYKIELPIQGSGLYSTTSFIYLCL
jgi:hypothetical protein